MPHERTWPARIVFKRQLGQGAFGEVFLGSLSNRQALLGV